MSRYEKNASECTEEELKLRRDEYDKVMAKADVERKRVDALLERKDYLITAYKSGDLLMSSGDHERMVSPRRFYADVSLSEIDSYIRGMTRGFWEHPDLLADGSNADDIPYEEKRWGKYSNIVIEPLSEELEKSYLDASSKDFFKIHRDLSSFDREKEVA